MSEFEQNTPVAGGSVGIVDRVKNILMSPKTEWGVIANESADSGKLLTGYAIPLMLIPTIATFVGYGVIGGGLLGAASISWGIGYAALTFISGLIGIYLSSIIINALAGTFGSRSDSARAMQMVVYAYTPMWVAGIFNIFLFLSWIPMVAGIYGIYLFYLGLPHVMQTPKDKVVAYMLVSFLVMVVVYFVLAAIIGGILFSIIGIGAIGAASMF